jgi:hypothetical protein
VLEVEKAERRYNLEITLDEAFPGNQAQIRIPTTGALRGLQRDQLERDLRVDVQHVLDA